MLCPYRHSALSNILPYPSYRLSRHTTMPFTHPYPLSYSACYTTLPVRPPVHYFALPVIPPYLSSRNARHTALLVMPPYLTYHPSCSIIAPYATLSVILPYPLPCPYRLSTIPVIPLCSSYLFVHHTPSCLLFSLTRDTALPYIPPFLLCHPVRHAILPVILPCLLLRHRSFEMLTSYLWWTIIFPTNFSGPICQAANKMCLALLCATKTPSRNFRVRETNVKIRWYPKQLMVTRFISTQCQSDQRQQCKTHLPWTNLPHSSSTCFLHLLFGLSFLL